MACDSSVERLLLVIETGNTTTSLAVFQGALCLYGETLETSNITSFDSIANHVQPLFALYPTLTDAVVCSVVPQVEKVVVTFLRDVLSGKVLQVNSSLQLPFTLTYNVPSTFGADRLALCAWSCLTFQQSAVIALDIGTACTVDVVSSNKHYLGGMIMPGLELMARALHEHTARLPLVNVHTKPASLLGQSTAECMHCGIVWNCTAGIEGIIRQLSQWLQREHQEQTITVVATGGGAPLITPLLSTPCIVDELAVMHGARLLFWYNINEQQ